MINFSDDFEKLGYMTKEVQDIDTAIDQKSNLWMELAEFI